MQRYLAILPSVFQTREDALLSRLGLGPALKAPKLQTSKYAVSSFEPKLQSQSSKAPNIKVRSFEPGQRTSSIHSGAIVIDGGGIFTILLFPSYLGNSHKAMCRLSSCDTQIVGNGPQILVRLFWEERSLTHWNFVELRRKIRCIKSDP